jgi:3-isopropylmalate dehydrogenase
MSSETPETAPRGEKVYRIACLPGDGIGPEVTAQARKAADETARRHGFRLDWTVYPYGAGHYLKTGEILPDSALDTLAEADALYLGAIGDPRVLPGALERGILLKLRFHFDQYVNLRPARSYPGVPLPVRDPGVRIDSVVVRENTEDLYLNLGSTCEGGRLDLPVDAKVGPRHLTGRLSLSVNPAQPFGAAVAVETRGGVERIARYAFETARRRGDRFVTLVTKSNAVPSLYGFFEEAVSAVAEEYPDLPVKKENVDALCYRLVRSPAAYGTILCPNLFGDIISDLQAGICGGMGVAPGANLGDGLSMFEPVHGSAPDIAGTGRANPMAAILAAAMMLEHLGEAEAAAAVEAAVERTLAEAPDSERPHEFGGTGDCDRVGDAVTARLL